MCFYRLQKIWVVDRGLPRIKLLDVADHPEVMFYSQPLHPFL